MFNGVGSMQAYRSRKRVTEIFKPMPPKREAAISPTQPPVKMIKIGSSEPQDMGCDPVDNSYRLSESCSYSPFPNHETEPIGLEEENDDSPGIRTDTISLLMKIEQLQAQLKYERRCRILAERELRELKEMNTLMMQMRHTAHELRVTLEHVQQGTELPQGSVDENISFIPNPEDDMRISHHDPEEDNNYVYLSEGLRLPRNLYERISEITDYKKYTSALLMMLFDRQTLATHSLQGRRTNVTTEDSQKPQLPPEILNGIIDHVGVKFGVDSSQIKTAIRTKLNNEDKLLKKRLGLGKPDNKMVVDQNLLAEIKAQPVDFEISSEQPL